MKLITAIKNLINRIRRPLYSLVYVTDARGSTERYVISSPTYASEYGNMVEGVKIKGFRAWAYNRNGCRSFNYHNIVSLNKLGLFERF